MPSAKITVTNASPATPWYTQLGQTNIPILANNSYQLLFDVKADRYRNIDIFFQQTNPPYKVYYQETVPIGPSNFGVYPKAVEFTMPSSIADSHVALRFNLGQTTGNIWLNNIQLIHLPNPHPVYFGMEFDNGMSQHDASKFLPAAQTEETKVQHRFSIVTNYQGWGNPINAPFMTHMYEDMREHGSIPLITWMPQNPSESTNCPNYTITSPCEPDYTLESIINGSHDVYIKSWADAAKAWEHPLMLRPMHEMNGNWYVWSEQQNGNKQGQFVQAWRHIVNIFRKEGVTNVTWVWCPNKDGGSGFTPLAELYPGDNYVDWTCVDIYNLSNSSDGWNEFYDAFRPTYQEILKIAPDKPMMVGETGTYENMNDSMGKANWITTAFTKAIPYIFPQVYAILYYDVPSECSQCKIDSSQNSLNAFIKAIQLPIYLSNSYSNLPAGIIGSDGQIRMPIIPLDHQPSPTPPLNLNSTSPTIIISPKQTQPNIPEQLPSQQVVPSSFQNFTNTEKLENTIEQTNPSLIPTLTPQPFNTFVSPIVYTILHPVTSIIQINNVISNNVNHFVLHLLGR